MEDGRIGKNDSVLFNCTIMDDDEEKIIKIYVGDPVDINGHIHFTVRGFDNDGEFEI